ncbi:MAG: phosphate transport system permease protein [Gammaproteobacteria bacterium]|nr:MAG: phosphate transport system permease protein [Gammaproteobacteria bacterium]TND06621.1 MAG: phosphate transport system permease protein [Gammaproteobacteria bacterium]
MPNRPASVSIVSAPGRRKGAALWRWRNAKDVSARHAMRLGGISVIVALLLIFFYLLYVVFPLFVPASIKRAGGYAVPAPEAGRTLHLAIEEQSRIAVRITDSGRAVFFDASSGNVISNVALPVPGGVRITSFAAGDPAGRLFAFGLSDGTALVARHDYRTVYADTGSTILPDIDYPLGDKPVVVDDRRRALVHLAIEEAGDETTLAAATSDNDVLLNHISREKSFLDEDEATIKRTLASVSVEQMKIRALLLTEEQNTLYVVGEKGGVAYFDIRDKQLPQLLQRINVTAESARTTSVSMLAGGISLVIGDSSGRLNQWFPVRDERNSRALTFIREFHDQRSPISAIAAEHGRKGFIAADQSGRIGLYHATAHRTLLVERIGEQAIETLAMAPRGNALLAEDQAGQILFWRIHNEHPEASWSALWQKVWYESYEKPDYIWQSSSASNDFEPKFSLTPLTFGTIKAAFYAMIFAIPLALLGAIYTAYFMAPRMRQYVKPGIEIMEALPTVILGFLAGLWLAPFIETHLPGFFLALIALPTGVLVFAYCWSRLPPGIAGWIPDGWHAAGLIPVLCAIAWLSFSGGPVIEQALFGGDLHGWLTARGIGFDQRNSLVVGLAMGFAVVPMMFSIAEDAVFSVPGHLTRGSLALGATPWQTLVRVVLLTASPGIFSAIMIGLGRAVGETMIVLMATGNTPVMDMSFFAGMRTLSANIAVEMPEAEVSSTHYRILFLAALVLFLFTFLVNTLAEIVRQRLRKKYSSL